MSGSGSTVFGLFQKRALAERAVEPLSRDGGRALLTESLGRGEYASRARPMLVGRAPGAVPVGSGAPGPFRSGLGDDAPALPRPSERIGLSR